MSEENNFHNKSRKRAEQLKENRNIKMAMTINMAQNFIRFMFLLPSTERQIR